MLSIALKNILKKKVLYLCLAAGFILSTAIVCAVPTYVSSILNNYINNIFTQAEAKIPSEKEKYIYPSAAYLSQSFGNYVNYQYFDKNYSSVKSMFLSEARKLPAPILAEKVTLSFDNIRYTYTKDNKNYDSINNMVISLTDFDAHINIINGRLSKGYLKDENTVEVIVDKRTFSNFNLVLDKDYEMVHVGKEGHPKMKVVGVFDIKDKGDAYWLDKETNFYCRFITTENGFLELFENNEDLGKYLNSITIQAFYDHSKITNLNARQVYEIGSNYEQNFIKRTNILARYTVSDTLKTYAANEDLYSTVLWIFLIPIWLVVVYYIWMISELIADSDKEQISVLRSRGANQLQILKQYAYEGLVLSITGLIIGPLLGFVLCKAMSYSDGFLIFNSMQKIEITYNNNVYLYALITVILLLTTLLASVFIAAKKSIVEVKQAKNRYFKILFKNKYMDLILLAIALYGYYTYSITNNLPALAGGSTERTPLDPLLYLVSTVFIVGFGMLLLRVYRYIMNILFYIGKRKFFTALYISLINVLRYHLKKSTAMLFIIITVAIGIFNIHIAKDINTSYTNTVRYTTGADMIIKGNWTTLEDQTTSANSTAALNTNLAKASKTNSNSAITTYIEPSFKQYSKIEGIESFTKVFRDDTGEASLGNNSSSPSSIMGIIPHEFGSIAYFDSDLTETHWFNYLNSMTKKPGAILISRGLSKASGINIGDTVFYKINQGLRIKGEVAAVVDYWPGYTELESKNLVIGNYNFMFSHMPIKPYEIWMKQKNGITSDFVYSSIKSNNIPISYLKDLNVETFNAKSDIYLKGTNSVLNLGFLSISAITILGFIVYWILSLRSRTLSFGIYRSLGISTKGITIMLVIEQVFTLGISISLGITAGITSGRLFIPLVKKLWYENKYVISAKNLQYINEYLQLSVVIILIFVVSFGVLTRYIKRLKVNQAIKLGED